LNKHIFPLSHENNQEKNVNREYKRRVLRERVSLSIRNLYISTKNSVFQHFKLSFLIFRVSRNNHKTKFASESQTKNRGKKIGKEEKG